MQYEFSKDPPNPIDYDEYMLIAKKDFDKLLVASADDEAAFQDFFEKNPSLIPGARGEFEVGFSSGHGPYLEALITQPKISGLATRQPDFLWLAYDSMVLNPILVEIEAPGKKYFNKDGTPTAKFTRAKNQLDEWKTILSQPQNISKFLSDFSLPEELTSLIFEPYFVLIYGRRKEYEKDAWLKQKRAHLLSRKDNQVLMSYDRLSLNTTESNYITCKVKNGNYFAKSLSPLFKLSVFDDRLLKIKALDTAISNMMYTSIERKEFLKVKIPKLLEYLTTSEKRGGGLILDGALPQFEE